MLTLLCFIFAITTVIGIVLYNKTNLEFTSMLIIAFSIIFLLVCVLVLIFCCSEVASISTIDEKISMYERENAEIEEHLNATLSTYLSQKNESIIALTPENVANVIVLYPELNSIELIASQLKTYTANYNEIISLKEKKIGLANTKWWINFGE
ncbi:MAG: hypothetical protein IJ272_08415 [Clostridia bacterium]|nr:hypothetical protein [Clostridia bacterium]